MGRLIHNTLTISQIELIVVLTRNGEFRPMIAKKIGVSNMTIWNYQKKLDLI